MDMTMYKDLKAKGAIVLQRLGKDTFQIISPRFDPHSGLEQLPEITPCNPSGVAQAITQLEEGMEKQKQAHESLIALKEDMDKLEEMKAKPTQMG